MAFLSHGGSFLCETLHGNSWSMSPLTGLALSKTPQMHLFKSVNLRHSEAGSRFCLVTHTHSGCSLHSQDGEGLDTRNERHHECQWIFFKFCMQLPWHISCILPKFQHCASLLEIAGDIILLLIPPNRPASLNPFKKNKNLWLDGSRHCQAKTLVDFSLKEVDRRHFQNLSLSCDPSPGSWEVYNT